jgi:hypothetical protein
MRGTVKRRFIAKVAGWSDADCCPVGAPVAESACFSQKWSAVADNFA